mmetsp:Transcript_18921/g.63409  ORF Transcript_18921/g.63409 Transcript_18921/m.63409 type:complete len:341 (-) Transcript_18921:399-1421(-)
MCTAAARVLARVHLEGSDEVLILVIMQLGAEDAAACRAVCRAWRALASGPDVWRPLCERLWADKAYIPQHIRCLAASNPCAAYGASLQDSRRCRITSEELCAFRWHSRMKEAAGPAWTAEDPWWMGREPRQRRFTEDGQAYVVGEGFGDEAQPTRMGTWSFLRRRDWPGPGPVPGPEQASDRIRLAGAGRVFPTLHVSRDPVTWGFVAQNCWGLSASFPLPPRGEAPRLEDGGPVPARVTVSDQWQEVLAYNTGIAMPVPQGYEVAPRAGEGPAAPEEGPEPEASIVLHVNGQPHRVPPHLLAQFLEQHMGALDGAPAGHSEVVDADPGAALSDDSDADA